MMTSHSPAGEDVLALRLYQQELIASFAGFAMRADELDPILEEACRVATWGLRCPLAKVLEYLPAEDKLLIRAGVGWQPGTIGVVKLGADLESPAGYAFKTGQPVLSNHLRGETRFRTPQVLCDQGVERAFNVLIGKPGMHFGVLEADSPDGADFEAVDTSFLEALASLLALAVARDAQQRDLEADRLFAQNLLDVSSDWITVLNPEGTITDVNVNGLTLMQVETPNQLLGQSWTALWPIAERDKAADALAEAGRGGMAQFDGQLPTFSGAARWWDVRVNSVDGVGARARQLIVIARDITDRVLASEAKDLLMLEVHHRVKNSLQLVQNLLTLQSRATADEMAAEQLLESASRVHTIAAIHDRLYRTGTELTVEVGPYLDGLVDDLRDAVASTVGNRPITVQADRSTRSAADLPAIGLVLTELVTNALKYGSGTIRISFEEPKPGCGVLVVEDEGRDLPQDFDPSRSKGLGMRLVLGLLRGDNAGLEIDRNAGHTRFVARLPPPRAGR